MALVRKAMVTGNRLKLRFYKLLDNYWFPLNISLWFFDALFMFYKMSILNDQAALDPDPPVPEVRLLSWVMRRMISTVMRTVRMSRRMMRSNMMMMIKWRLTIVQKRNNNLNFGVLNPIKCFYLYCSVNNFSILFVQRLAIVFLMHLFSHSQSF